MVDISRGWHGPRRALAVLWAERLGANLTAAGLAAEIERLNGECTCGSDNCPVNRGIKRDYAFRLGIAEAGAP